MHHADCCEVTFVIVVIMILKGAKHRFLFCFGFVFWYSLGSVMLVACLLTESPSNSLVYLRDGSAQAVVHAATLR